MLIVLMFVQINSLFVNYNIYIDKLFNQFQNSRLSTDHCTQIEISRDFYYRGKPKDFKDIINSNEVNFFRKQNNLNLSDENTKIEKYSAIFINKKEYLDYIFLFSKKTLFFMNNDILLNKNEEQKYKNFCILSVKSSDFSSYSYYIISKNLTDSFILYIGGFLFVFLFVIFILIIIFSIHSCFWSSPFFLVGLYIYNFAHLSLLFNIIVIFSLLGSFFFLLSICFYSFYKAFILGHLLILLDGFSILEFQYSFCTRFKFYLKIFFVECFLNIFFEYIVYFIPSLDNFELFFIKNLFEHTTILIFGIISFLNKFIRLYKQYKFDRRLRTILTLGYRIKVIIYSKVFIFSFLYSIGFIILYFVELSYSINKNVFGFYFNYSINIALEMLFSIVLFVMFFPLKMSFFYFYPIFYDYESVIFLAQIEKEKNYSISNLKKDILKEYQKKEYPLVFINPFAKNLNEITDAHVGMVEAPKKIHI